MVLKPLIEEARERMPLRIRVRGGRQHLAAQRGDLFGASEGRWLLSGQN